MKCVLITQREQTDQYGEQTDVLESAYVRYFQELGYLPIPVSNFCEEPGLLYEAVCPDAVILTGGGSLPTEYYDEDYGYSVQENRDKVETILVREALERNVPILGICRGMQFLNGYFGGKVSRLHLTGERPNGKDHPVIFQGRTLMVNNFHNDGIFREKLADGLTVLAEDMEFGVVEAFYSESDAVLGLQWHPERRFADEGALETTKSMIQCFIQNNIKNKEIKLI